MMMTYDEAKVFELMKGGPAHFAHDIFMMSPFPALRTLNAMVSLRENGFIEHKREDNIIVVMATEKGKEAFENWSEIPF